MGARAPLSRVVADGRLRAYPVFGKSSSRHRGGTNRLVRLLRVAVPAVFPLSLSAEAAPSYHLLPPVESACISSSFGPRVLPARPHIAGFHPGIDLPAPLGAQVRAVAPGTIIRAQRRGAGGLEVLVQHDGFIGIYSHLGLIAPVILNGARAVSTGQQIGTVGRSGLTYGPHLYFGMLVNGRAVDPSPYLRLPACNAGNPDPAPPATGAAPVPRTAANP